MSHGKTSRRDFLRLSATTAAGATLAACTTASVPQDLLVRVSDKRLIFNRYAQPDFAPQAVYLYANDPVVQLDEEQEFLRNEHQLATLQAKRPEFSVTTSVFGPALDWAYRQYAVQHLSRADTSEAGTSPLGTAPVQAVDRATRAQQIQDVQIRDGVADPTVPRLCFFNLLVALEWQPDQSTMRQLEWAFRRSSDFLYDTTDGCMAFGQVVFGGPDMMDVADIQIMASNQLHPRSWVSGLHVAAKYMPIRMGRGMWHRKRKVAVPWNEPEGYRALVHEWAHYALDLRDAYLEPRQVDLADQGLATDAGPATVVLPTNDLMSESIMAVLEGTSELVPHAGGGTAARKSEEWQLILSRYPWLNPSAQALEGPGGLPLPLPHFQWQATLVEQAAQHWPGLDSAALAQGRKDLLLRTVPTDLQLDRSWVYVLPGITAAQPYPTHVIAQGTFDARVQDDGFRLLGAGPGDTLVIMGSDTRNQPVVFRGVIDVTEADGQALAGVTWQQATPDGLPTVDVLPGQIEPSGKLAQVSVRVDTPGGTLPDQVWLFPLGQTTPEEAQALGAPTEANWISASRSIPTLDGHVLVQYGDKFAISSFSQGGNAPSSSPRAPVLGGAPIPITAGSADGTVMLFFHDNASTAEVVDRTRDVAAYSQIKVVTAIDHGAPGTLPAGAQPWSYTFSLASNAPLPTELAPTLVLHFDMFTQRAGTLRVHRLTADGTWTPLPTYVPHGFALAAVPLNAATAGRLVAADVTEPRVERFRLFWMTDEA